jgi:processive 1,2-diacylglycerol beta-glucosyltransferase
LKETQALFLAGRNERLHSQISRLARQSPFPTRVIGYTNAMEKLMGAADIMISKLGGLTTYEALASRLPIIADTITPPMPQEARTANLISQNKAGLLLRNVRDIVPLVRRLTNESGELENMRIATTRLAIPDATQRIVNELLRKIEERVATAGNPTHLTPVPPEDLKPAPTGHSC